MPSAFTVGDATSTRAVTLHDVDADGAATVYVLKVLEDVGEQPYLMGDVNDDGIVDVADISLTIDAILGVATSSFHGARADMNADDLLDVTDVSLMIQLALEM